MADNIPAKLKPALIAPFLKRAAQLERFKPIITYWLHFYVVQKIISSNLHSADSECSSFTADLMEKLEQTKAQNPTEEAYVDEEAAAAYCEQFALQTFAKGDRDMNANTVTKNTADTLLAASTFLEMLALWKRDADPEIKSKQTFAKYHAVRILKAFQAGEDPNLTNPVHEPPPVASPSALDPNDPEVQNINQSAAGHPPSQNPYQPYVETVPNASAHPSPDFSAPKLSPPPPHFPSAPNQYRDVSPISQPSTSRRGSVTSAGGGYFPRVDVPTFTADTAAPSLPTTSSVADEPMSSPFGGSSLPTGSHIPQAPQVPTPQNFYQNAASPPPTQPFQQQQPSAPPPNTAFTPVQQLPFQQPFQQQQQQNYSSPPQQHFQAPPQQYTQQTAPPLQALHQGPFRTDEDSQTEAIRHAKFAQSALNFEDVNTAVKELRLALAALGAN